jgi:nucleoside-diphosphate-sugar epimerase
MAEAASGVLQSLASRRVLVTGATGFVGRHLVQALRASGHSCVRILTRSAVLAQAAFGPLDASLEVRTGDLLDPGSLVGLCDGVEVVFHVAGAGLSPGNMPRTAGGYHRVNVEGTAALAAEAAASGVARLVYVSSTGAMGAAAEPLITESTPCRPASPYQRSKRAAEERLLELHRRSALGVVIVRPCLITGEGKRGGELLRLFRLCRAGLFPVIGRALEAEKPLVWVEDVVQALMQAAVRGRPGEIYLVHSGSRYTLGEILRAAGELVGNPRPYRRVPLGLARAASRLTTPLARLLGRRPPLSPKRLELFVADRHIEIRKATEELGYRPALQDLREMLGRTCASYVRTGQLRDGRRVATTR